MGLPPLSQEQISSFAKSLDNAEQMCLEIEPPSISTGQLTLKDAYRIQDTRLALQLARGDHPVGFKLGLTSKTKMKQMGVDSPIYGVLTDRMKISSQGLCDSSKLIHPKIEPELAFLVGNQDLRGELSPDQALEGCSGVCAALEIVDSRYKHSRFEVPEGVADNCSAARFVLGDTIRNPTEIELENLGLILELDGQAARYGSTAAVFGNPVYSLVWLCRILDQRGLALPARSIVLTGAVTSAMPFSKGSTVSCHFHSLGEVRVQT